MQDEAKSLEKKHEWGWPALVIAIIVVNLGAHVWHEVRGCKGPMSALKLCKTDPAQASNRR